MTVAFATDTFGRVFVITTSDVGAVHREPLEPGQWGEDGAWDTTDVSAYPQSVQSECAAVWTGGVVAAFKAAFPWRAPTAASTNPLDYVLTKRQVCSALIMAGVTDDPDGFVLGVLATIPDAQAKALAINDWRYAPSYHRDNPLFNDPSLLGAAGITTQQIDQFWLLGTQQPA